MNAATASSGTASRTSSPPVDDPHRQRGSVVGEALLPYANAALYGPGFGGYALFAAGSQALAWFLWSLGLLLVVGLAIRSRRIGIVDEQGELRVVNMWSEKVIPVRCIRRVRCSRPLVRSRLPVLETAGRPLVVQAGYRPKERRDILQVLERSAVSSNAVFDLRLTDVIRGRQYWRPGYPDRAAATQ
jgi:hypothetical protein